MVDGRGVRASGNAPAYVATLFLFDGLPYFLLVMHQRRHRLAETLTYLRARWPVALAGSMPRPG